MSDEEADVFRDRFRDRVVEETAAVILVAFEELGVVVDLGQAVVVAGRLMDRGFVNPVPF